MVGTFLAVVLRGVAAVLGATADPGAAEPSPEIAEPPIRILAEVDLPSRLSRASDVRWLDDETALLTVLDLGVVSVPLASPERFRIWWPTDHRDRGLWLPSRLGVTDTLLVVAAPVFQLDWSRRGTGRGGRIDFGSVEDLDAAGDRIAVFGLRQDDEGSFAPDGVIVWLGTPEDELGELRPVHRSTAGAGAGPIDACGGFEIGAIRFLPSGTVLFVPGAEPGAFEYDAGGRLVRQWDTRALGIDTACTFDEETVLELSRDPIARWAWVDRHVVLDEILPLADRPGLIVRRSGKDGVTWELVRLGGTGAPRRAKLLVPGPAGTHLRGDVRGDRALLLRFERAVETGRSGGRLFVVSVGSRAAEDPQAASR